MTNTNDCQTGEEKGSILLFREVQILFCNFHPWRWKWVFFLSSSSTWLVRLHRAGRFSPICLSCLFPLLIYIILYIDLRDPRLARCRHRKLMNSAGWLFCSLNNISNSIAGGRIHVGNQFDYRLLPCLLFWLRRFLHRPLILLDVFAAPKQELAGDFRFMFLSLSHRRSIRHTQQQQQRESD